MSTWNLIKVMQQKDPITFKKLSRTTIEAWIDQSDPEWPCWSTSTLAKAEAANFQGHANGGWKGALVRIYYIGFLSIVVLNCIHRPVILKL